MASARVKEERCTDSPEPTVKCEVDSPPVEEWWCAVSPAPEPTDFDFGSLETRNRTTHEQFLTLLDFMERHGDLGRPQHGAQAKLRGEQKWQELAATLNSVAGGIEKTMDKWKKVWADWKTKTKKKHTLIRRYARGAGGRPHGRQALNALEKRVVAVMRNTAALRSQREDEAFSAQAQARDPLYQGNQVNQVNQVHQHMFEMPCNNRTSASDKNPESEYSEHKTKAPVLIAPDQDCVVKSEPELEPPWVKVEIEEEKEGINKEEQAELYAGHTVKRELVLGPELIQAPVAAEPQDISTEKDTKPGCGEQENIELLEEKQSQAPLLLYECDHCNQQCNKKNTLIAHMKLHASAGPHVCDICNKQFSQKCYLRLHKRVHTGERPYSCDVCNAQFRFKHNLITHNTTHKGEKPHTCDVCNKKFTAKYSLKRHRRVHANDASQKPHECDVCNKRFATKSGLNAHQLIHAAVKPYACDICNKQFRQRSILNEHKKRTHTNETPFSFSCDVCDKKFSSKGSYSRHYRLHTGDTPHVCDVCNKQFVTKNRMVVHKLTHKGEKPHSCDVCNKQFSQRSSLIYHKRVHTGEKPHACDVCDKQFAQRYTLIVHRRTHTGERPYACDFCDSRFAHRSHLVSHIRSKHAAQASTE